MNQFIVLSIKHPRKVDDGRLCLPQPSVKPQRYSVDSSVIVRYSLCISGFFFFVYSFW